MQQLTTRSCHIQLFFQYYLHAFLKDWPKKPNDSQRSVLTNKSQPDCAARYDRKKRLNKPPLFSSPYLKRLIPLFMLYPYPFYISVCFMGINTTREGGEAVKNIHKLALLLQKLSAVKSGQVNYGRIYLF